MNITLIGYGNVGKEIAAVLKENNIPVDYIIRSNGVYDSKGLIDAKENFAKYIDSDSFVFISVPSRNNGEEVSGYYIKCLEKSARIITCEKAFIANHWGAVQKFKNHIKYSATVGGDSGILDAISGYEGELREIKAVVNGTLNYISNRLADGLDKNAIYKEVMEKGFAEPDSRNFNEAIENELKDVAYKTAILANYSGFYKNILMPEDIKLEKYKDSLRCFVLLSRENIRAGFMKAEDASWFPKGANNVLYINNEKMAEGAGAGGRITAERMFKDFKKLTNSQQ